MSLKQCVRQSLSNLHSKGMISCRFLHFFFGIHILAEVLSFPRFGMSHVSHIAIGLPDSNYLASVFGVFSVPPFRTLSTWECQVNLT